VMNSGEWLIFCTTPRKISSISMLSKNLKYQRSLSAGQVTTIQTWSARQENKFTGWEGWLAPA
jgi:hypothetical protein